MTVPVDVWRAGSRAGSGRWRDGDRHAVAVAIALEAWVALLLELDVNFGVATGNRPVAGCLRWYGDELR